MKPNFQRRGETTHISLLPLLFLVQYLPYDDTLCSKIGYLNIVPMAQQAAALWPTRNGAGMTYMPYGVLDQ